MVKLDLKNRDVDIMKDILLIVLLVIGVICFFYDAKYVNEWDLSGDVTDGHYALYAEIAQTIHDGELPLWSSLHGGMTEVGNPVVQAFYPITNILCRVCYLEDEGYLSYSIVHYEMLIHYAIFAVGIYVLVRLINKRRWTAFFIALLCSFTSCVFQMHGWLYIWGGLVYMPYIVGFAIKMMQSEDRRNLIYVVLGGICIGLSGLAAPCQGVLINIVAFAIVYICCVLSKIKKGISNIIRLTCQSVLTGLLGIGFMSITLFPVAELLVNSYRYISDGEAQTGISSKMSYSTFVLEKLTLNDVQTILFTYWGWWSVGMILAALLIIGIFIPRAWDTNWAVGISLVLFSILYGCAIVVTRIFYHIPFYNSIREPYLYTFMAIVGIAIMSAYGMDSILDVIEEKAQAKRIVRFFLALIFFCLVGREVVLFRSNVNNRLCTANQATKIINSVNRDTLKLYSKYITGDESEGRIWQWATEKGYPVNTAAVLHWDDLDAYMNPCYLKTYNLKSYVSMDKRLELQNVQYIICSSLDENRSEYLQSLGYQEIARVLGAHDSYPTVNEGESILYKKIQNSDFGWMVYDYDLYDDNTDIVELSSWINAPEYFVKDNVLVNKDTCKKETLNMIENVNLAGDNSVDMISRKHNMISFKVDTTENGVFVTSEVNAPGWKVYVDGKRADIIEVNGEFRGVVLQSGEHTIKFKYMPISFVLGCIYFVICVPVCIILVLIGVGKYEVKLKRLNIG